MANTPLSIPSATAICNPKTGVITQEWRLWFNRLYQRAGGADAPSNGEIGEQVLVGQEGINILQGEVGELQSAYAQLDGSVDSLVLKVNANAAAIASANASISSLQGSMSAANDAIGVLTVKAVQTVATVGSGLPVVDRKSDSVLSLKSLKAGSGISLDDATTPGEILITAGSALSRGFGDLNIILGNGGVGSGSGSGFTVKGGSYWTIARYVTTASLVTVNDFNSSSQVSNLAANQNYYIIFDFTTNVFRFVTSPSASSWTYNGNGKLMWILTTNATAIVSAIDYRAMDIYLRPRTFMATAAWVTGARAYTIASPFLANMNQKPVSGEITGTYFPRYTRFQVNFLCLVADQGYAVGDETTFITGDGTIWGNPQVRINNSTGAISIFQGAETRIMNATTFAWATPAASAWAVVLKVSFENH